MLDVRHLEVWYGITEVLRDVSFTVPARSIVALLGGNGSGKTTLVNAISGLIPPRAGTILVDGYDATRASADRMVRLGVVQIPQGREVFADMTVHDNLELGAYLRKDKVAEAEYQRIFTLFPVLKERIKQNAGTLSGGEQQMLAISRALMSKPAVLLLDEPSLGLAPQLVQAIFRVIKEINAEGTTILLVEQNAHMALMTAHRGYVMETGRIVLHDTTKALLASDRVKKAYLGG